MGNPTCHGLKQGNSGRFGRTRVKRGDLIADAQLALAALTPENESRLDDAGKYQNASGLGPEARCVGVDLVEPRQGRRRIAIYFGRV